MKRSKAKLHIPSFLLLIALFFFSGCQENEPLFETQQILQNDFWPHEKPLAFSFEVNEPLKKNIFYTLRHHRDYRYCNLFVSYALVNAANDTLKEARVERSLYDCTTGRPFGRGIEQWYDHEISILPQFEFPVSGTYRLLLSHQMRPDTLSHIRAVGITVRESLVAP